jgi:hypothetical protein
MWAAFKFIWVKLLEKEHTGKYIKLTKKMIFKKKQLMHAKSSKNKN